MGKLSLVRIIFSHKLYDIVRFRSYVQETINGSEILSGGIRNAYFHFAVIQDIWGDYWASCLTYVPQHRVPPGEQYSVIDKIIKIH